MRVRSEGGARGPRQGRGRPGRVRAGRARHRGSAPARNGKLQASHGRGRGPGERDEDPERLAPAPLPARGRGRGGRDAAAQVPLSRHAASLGLEGVPGPRPGVPGRARLPARRGLSRGGDAVSHAIDAGRRARFSRPQPDAAGQLLRAPPVAAALQAALDGGGLRAVFPDRSLLPRRGPPERPPAGVHPDRHRNVLPRPRRFPAHHRGHGRGDMAEGEGGGARASLPAPGL